MAFCPSALGIFKLQSEDKVTRLAWPLVGWVLADAFDVRQALGGRVRV
jgi:hypothetical protein